jgi:hypothetical protein
MAQSIVPPRNIPPDAQDDSDVLNEHVDEPGDPDGVIAAEQRQRWQERHPTPSNTPRAEYKRKRRWPLALLVLVLLAGASYGAYTFGQRAATHKQATTKQPTTTTQPAVTSQTRSYTSTNYSLSFNYPANWIVSDTASKLTITSPAMKLKSAVGANVNAHVVVTIENQQTSIAGYPSTGAIAAIASNDMSYAQPSSIQRAQTYVSYLSYTEASGLDEIYVTGDNGYQQGQQVPMSSIVEGNPLIGVGFENCQSNDCSTGTSDPVTLLASSWSSTNVSKQVISLLESIVITS